MKKHSAAARYLSVFLTFVMLLSSPGALLVESDMLYEEEYIQTEEASEAAAGGSAQGSYSGSSDTREAYEEPAEDVETGYEVAGSNTGDPSPYVENAQQTGSENGSGTGASGSADVSQAGSSSAGTDGTQTAGTSTTSPVVTWRSLTVEAKPAVLYEGSNQVTEDFLKAQAIWPYLYNRDLSYELSEQVRNTDGTLIQPGGEVTYDYGSNELFSYEGSYLNLYNTSGETRPLIIEVSGVLPSDVTVEARYIDFGRTGIDGAFHVNFANDGSKGKQYDESALAAVFVTLKDSNGNTYIPTGDLFIAAGGSIVNDAVHETQEGASLLVYEFEEDAEREQQLGKYAASVSVHKNPSDSNTRTLYGRGMSGNEVTFSESSHNLSQYVNNTISFDADQTSMNFVISGQLPEKTKAPDEEIDGEHDKELSEDFNDESTAYGFNPDEINDNFNADEVNDNFNANDIYGDVVVYDSVNPADGQNGDEQNGDAQNGNGQISGGAKQVGGQDVASPGIDLDGDGIYDVLYGPIEDRDPIGRPADANGGNEAAGENAATEGDENHVADSGVSETDNGSDSSAESGAAADDDATDGKDVDGKDTAGNDSTSDMDTEDGIEVTEDTVAADTADDEKAVEASEPDDKNDTEDGSNIENADGLQQLIASGVNYEVSVTYGQEANVPAGAELQAEELSQGNGENSALVSQVADALGASESDIVSVTLLDLSILKDGEVIEPDADVDVKVQVNSAYADPNTEYQVVSLGATSEVLDGTVTEDAVDYETSVASMDPVYAIVERIIHVETNYKDCAGDTWKVSVDYDTNAGIPEGAQLVVRELTDEEYAEYIAQSAELLGVAPEEVSIDKALDITLVKDGVEYHELNNGVNVTIELLDTEVTDDMQVLHMGDTPENMYAYAVDNTLNFVADGFSVFVITRVVKVLTLDASDGNTYRVTVTYDTTCGIPADAELVVSEIRESDVGYAEYLEKSAQILGETTDALVLARPFDITLKNLETGELYQPNRDVLVTIELLDEELAGYDDVNVVHIHGEEEKQVEVLDSRLNGEVVEFETSGFSVFVVVQTIVSQTLTASDGNGYLVTVMYNNTSGIPKNAELVVSELKPGDAGYDEYVAAAAEKLGESLDNLALVRPFDITLKNPQTGEEYQPNKDVTVSIQLLNDDLNDYADVDVIHFHGEPDGESAIMDSNINRESVEFETDGFSVYVLTGISWWTFTFWGPQIDSTGNIVDNGETMQGDQYLVTDFVDKYQLLPIYTTESGTTVQQRIKGGERPIVPQPANTTAVDFAGWFQGEMEGSNVKLSTTVYDFDSIPDTIPADKQVNLFARYANYYTVTFHDQYNSEIGDYPVALTRRSEVKNGSAEVRIGDLTAVYNNGSSMAFYGWSETPVQTTGEGKNNKITEDTIIVDGNKELYPIFQPINWLYFYSAQSGSGATYIPTEHFFEGEGTSQLAVPEWAGHTFEGWYTGVLNKTINSQGKIIETVTYSVKVTDENGYIENVEIPGVLQRRDSKLLLSSDATLYARWGDETTVNYKVIIWKQKTTDATGLENAAKTYDFYESFIKTVPTGSTAVIDAAYKAYATSNIAEFGGYTCRYDGDTPVNEKGYTVLNVWYDRNGEYTEGAAYHTLSFVDSKTPSVDGLPARYENAVYYQTSLLTGNNGGSYVPADPHRDHYTFTGWYADQNCTTRVFFSQEELDAYEGYDQTVLYDIMPNCDLSIYAGWEAEWYLVQIDPNYGTLNGSGGTWFWETIDGDLVREYTQVTRDYLPTSAGEYYYVKHDRAYYGYVGNEWDQSEPERDAYYTTLPGEATEDTTFEYAPGVYSYAGWYEVLSDGREIPYDFSQHVDHDTTLKLHWKKSGIFSAVYNTTVTENGEILVGTLSGAQPEDDFTDHASITVNCSATAPSGYTFAGWRVRGDDSEKVYGPGETFTLRADYAVLVSGKYTVFLDAVYDKAKFASIVYDANGGTVTDAPDYGFKSNQETNEYVEMTGTVDTTAGTATVTGLTNNSKIKLSSGAGFSFLDNGTSFSLLGWSHNQVFRPDMDTLFECSGEYGVDKEEPVTLYMVWGVPVIYHLNGGDEWGGTWDNSVYIFDGDTNTYSQTAFWGNAVLEPAYYPTKAGKLFAGWVAAPDGTDLYDFSQPVEHAQDLYARWIDPFSVPVHAVDSSAKVLAEKTSSDIGWTVNNLPVGMSSISLPDSSVTAPGNYKQAFVAASENLTAISEQDQVVEIQYIVKEKAVCVRFVNESEFTPLGSRHLYYVFYKERPLDICYRIMQTSGELTELTSVDPVAPDSTVYNLGSYNMAEHVTQPKGWASGSVTYYAYAIGKENASNASHLSLITSTSNSDDARPPLLVENTWRGFRYSEDGGATWVDCGFEPTLYVVYFAQQPTIIMFSEQTVGLSTVVEETSFTYNLVVTETTTSAQKQQKNGFNWENVGSPEDYTSDIFSTAVPPNAPYVLKNGEANSAILFYSTPTAGDAVSSEFTEGTDTFRYIATTSSVTSQTAVITQTSASEFKTVNSSTGSSHISDYECAFISEADGGTKAVTFTNTHKALTLEIHIAVMETDGIVLKDDNRTAQHTITVPQGETKSFTEELAPDAIYTAPAGYAFGAVVYGRDDGSGVNIEGMDVTAVGYERLAPPDGNICELILKNAENQKVTELGSYRVYYFYYPMPVIRYIRENADGTVTTVKGSHDGTAIVDDITYNRANLTVNGVTVSQDQVVKIPLTGLRITQETGTSHFRMPALLDDGIYMRYLSYEKLGVGDGTTVTTMADFGTDRVSAEKELFLAFRGNDLWWSFDNARWTEFTGMPTIYAIYEVRGYDLEITKSVPVDVGGNPDFRITIQSEKITKPEYGIEGYTSDKIQAQNGKIELTVRDGSVFRIIGLAQGDYTVTETGNINYNLTVNSRPLNGGIAESLTVTDNSSVTLKLDREKQVELKNTSKEICKITVNGLPVKFYTLQSAIEYIRENLTTAETIEMLCDYEIPVTDRPVIPSGYSITITTDTTEDSGSFNHQYATIKRATANNEQALLTNNGTLRLEKLWLDGNRAGVVASKAMVVSSGALTLTDVTLVNAKSSGNGGAIFADGGIIYLTGSTAFQNNQANNGGAIYSTGNGIEISTAGNTVTFGGTSATSNTAEESGGAIYYDGAGEVAISGNSSFQYNQAANGGAVYIGAGTVSVAGTAVLTNNKAVETAGTNGFGGAIYVDSGVANISGGSIGQNGKANTAKNGAAVYVASGSATFSGGNVAYNNASSGGAVGVGGTSARLYFTANAYIRYNTMSGESSNVYLDVNTDTVINEETLNAVNSGTGIPYVGIYVPGAWTDQLVIDRGLPGASFGVFANKDRVTAFHNDRIEGLTVTTDTDTKRMIWGKSIKVQVWYKDKYGNINDFPQKSSGNWNGQQKYPTTSGNWQTYYLPDNENAVSAIADDLRGKYALGLSDTATFAYAFTNTSAQAIGNDSYITEVNWNTAQNKWLDNNGTEVTQLVVYFSEPAYISIENNTKFPLIIGDAMQVLGKNVTRTTEQAGYGYVYAVNGAIQDTLQPITAGNLTLNAGKSIKLLFPGAVGKGYSLPGGFTVGTDTVTDIPVSGTNPTATLTGDNRKNFTLSANTVNTNGGTTDIIFGGARPICKIVVSTDISGVTAAEHDGTDVENDGRVAYLFSSLNRAVTFAKNNISTDTAAVELLTDYLLPGSDVLNITGGYGLTFKTAIGDMENDYNYSSDPSARATISRDTGNTTSFIKAEAGTFHTLTIENLIFDGKNFAGSINGGLVTAKDYHVVINNSEFLNCKAKNGGGIYINYTQTSDGGNLTVTDTIFSNCASTGTSREGGGAIWTTAKTLKLIGCSFSSCSATDQGGAVFHRIDTETKNYTPQSYKLDSVTIITGCDFQNCTSRSGGAVESDAHHVLVGILPSWTDVDTDTDPKFRGGSANELFGDVFTNYSGSSGKCIFESCRSIKTSRGNGSGGAVCTYIYEKSGYVSWGGDKYDTYLTLIGCEITRCSSATGNANSGFGGGVRSHSAYTWIQDCTFTSCEAELHGGAIAMYNVCEKSTRIIGCTIEKCSAKKNGGAVYISSSGAPNTFSVIIDGCPIKENSAGEKGGGVYTDNHITLRNNTKIQNNHLTTNTVDNAAGVYINGKTLTVGDSAYNTYAASTAADVIRSHRDLSSVSGNTVKNGTASNLRLKGGNDAASLVVNCHMGGYIGVINHGDIGMQFGNAPTAVRGSGPYGFSAPTGTDDYTPTFYADDGTTYGIIDRSDDAGKKIIWAGPPICKITDGNQLLYLDADTKYPAIFDQLESGSGVADGSWGSAFSFLRGSVPLYYANGNNYSGSKFYVEMLVDTYGLGKQAITKKASDNAQEIILRTAKPSSDMYGYRGTEPKCTIIRKSGFSSSLFQVRMKLTFEDIIVDGGKEKGLIADTNGGILWINDSQYSYGVLGEGAMLQNSETSKNGGAVCANWGSFELAGGTIQNCEATENGGAVYMASRTQTGPDRGYLKINSGIIQNCSAANGGAVYVNTGTLNVGAENAGAVQIRNCEATENGGGICHVADGQTATPSFSVGYSAVISGCGATTGGGVYVAEGKTMNMSTAYITGNHASSGGGIAVGGANAKLQFSGASYVSGNTLETGNVACNVQMDRSFSTSENNPATVIVANGITAGARIGVYVPDAQYDDHGDEGDPFGTFTSNQSVGTLYGFVNDKNGLKGGLGVGQDTGSDKKVYWIKIFSLEIIKEVDSSVITDEDQEFTFRITLTGTATDGTSAENITTPSSDPMKYGAVSFKRGEATVKLKPGESVTAEFIPAGLDYKVTEELSDEQKKYFTVQPYSEQNGEIGENAERTDVDRYLSVVTFTNVRPVCKITNAANEVLYYYQDGKYFPAVFTSLNNAMEKINDNNVSNVIALYFKQGSNYLGYNDTYPYMLKLLTGSYTLTSQLTIKSKKTVVLTTALVNDSEFPFQNDTNIPATVYRGWSSNSNDYQMFVVKGNGQLVVNNITLDGQRTQYTGSKDGGIVKVETNGKLYLLDGATLKNSVTKGNGGAIYAAEGSCVYLSGSVSFGGSGRYNDGTINSTQGNFSTKNNILPANARNGGQNYTLARQDIFIAGYEGEARNVASLVVIGDITSGDGAIWVWAEKDPHYKSFLQFATYKTDSTTVCDGISCAGVTDATTTLAAFRNARPDNETGADQAGQYLYGITKSNDTEKNVFWYGVEGSAHVMLVKVLKDGNSYKALSSKNFTVYTDSAMTKKAKGTIINASGIDEVIELSDLVSGAGGAFFIGELSYGTYYIAEDGVSGFFEITVDEKGVVEITDPNTNPKTTSLIKAVTLTNNA